MVASGTESTVTTGSTAGNDKPGISHAEDKRFSVVDMAALGGVLGALLLLALIALVTLIHKHYGSRFKCCSGKALVRPWGWGTGQERDRWRERDQTEGAAGRRGQGGRGGWGLDPGADEM